jgi:predicted transcriptional regulator
MVNLLDDQRIEGGVAREFPEGRAEQARLYGEPLGEIVSRCADVLGITQGRIAEILNMSAPMLSQLVSGRRIKIGNPAAVQRLGLLSDLATQVAASRLTRADALNRLDSASQMSGVITNPTRDSTMLRGAEVRGVLRAVASASELLDAADRLAESHPRIAEVLRVYGAGRTDEAVAHYDSIRDLL